MVLTTLTLLGMMTIAQADPNAGPLDAKVRARIAKTKGTVSLSAKNLDSGATYALNPDAKVRTASTIKLPVMVECYKAVADGRAQWSTELLLRDEDKVSGSGVLFEFSHGAKIFLRDAMHLMIVVSDNTATNLILDKLTANAVNKTMDALGLPDTRSLRKVRGDGTRLKAPTGWSDAGLKEENKKYGLGVSTPREMVKLLELLEQGKVVSPAASKEMIDVLKRQQLRDGIARTTGENPAVASKTGSLDRLRADVGIVYTPKGRIAMAITIDDLAATDYSPDNPGLFLISDVSKLLVEGLAK
jgi:beta-lactamase class A